MFRTKFMFTAMAAALALAVTSSLSIAQTPNSAEARQAELKAAWQEANKAGRAGPADIPLRDQATLKLPARYFFVPASEGARVMRAYGNTVNTGRFTGLIVGTNPADNWVIVVNFVKEGYIKDDDAKDWKADELLKSLREGTEQANKERAKRGFAELEIVDWVEKPGYDASTHRLVWSLSTKRKGEAENASRGVNYNTYALGREGYFSLNLLTKLSDVEALKPVSKMLLGNLEYQEGKRYVDFNPATDKVASYGLAALVGVAAAKKLGLFALIFAFAAKFAKVALLGLAAIGALLAKMFFSRKSGGSA